MPVSCDYVYYILRPGPGQWPLSDLQHKVDAALLACQCCKAAAYWGNTQAVTFYQPISKSRSRGGGGTESHGWGGLGGKQKTKSGLLPVVKVTVQETISTSGFDWPMILIHH
jgi:hypothetical protein